MYNGVLLIIKRLQCDTLFGHAFNENYDKNDSIDHTNKHIDNEMIRRLERTYFVM